MTDTSRQLFERCIYLLHKKYESFVCVSNDTKVFTICVGKKSKKIKDDYIMLRQYNINLFEINFAYQYWSRRHIDGSKNW